MLNAGSYTIIPAAGTLIAANYNFTGFINSTLTITPATLTVTADSKSRVYGAADQPFTASYSGFQNGETLVTSGITGGPNLTCDATATGPIGIYTITVAQDTLDAQNYNFTFVSVDNVWI